MPVAINLFDDEIDKGAPKCFISYSWTSPEHQTWVLQFATELRDLGVDVILDKWDLKEGHDANAFMEKMVSDGAVTKVILICDAAYVDKANARKGGVGTEAQIISPAVYKSTDQTKFVAVVRQRNQDGEAYVPAYYGSRIHIDLSSDDVYTQNFEQLVRWVFDKPLHIKPPLGKPPAYLSAAGTPLTPHYSTLRRAIEILKSGQSNSVGTVDETLASIAEGFESFRIAHSGRDFDDKILESIDSFLPQRNALIELFIAIARYCGSDVEMFSVAHRFFESLIKFLRTPRNAAAYTDIDHDNFKFIVHEVFLYFISILINHRCFAFACHMMREHYFVMNRSEEGTLVSFATFRSHMRSLEIRNQRLGLRRLSVRADMLEKRCTGVPINFSQLARRISCSTYGAVWMAYATVSGGPRHCFTPANTHLYLKYLLEASRKRISKTSKFYSA